MLSSNPRALPPSLLPAAKYIPTKRTPVSDIQDSRTRRSKLSKCKIKEAQSR
jgi:hypothetical protein